MKIIFCILILLFLLPSCKKSSFQYKLSDYIGYYDEGFDDNTAEHLPKFREGWFELRIREETENIDGVEVRKFVVDPNLDFTTNPNPASFEFYSYIAFIDNHRLVFYTPFRGSSLEINKDFNLYNRKQTDFQRGYYLYKHPSKKDTLGKLQVLLENRKKDRQTELVFEVQYETNSDSTLEVASLKLIQMYGPNDTPLNSKSPNSKREYKSAELFSFQPTYFFSKDSLSLSAKEKGKGKSSIQIDSIFVNTKQRKRYYYYKEQLVLKELLQGNEKNMKDTLRTW